jgi:hypothetical protein
VSRPDAPPYKLRRFFYALFYADRAANPGETPDTTTKIKLYGGTNMAFFDSAVDVLQMLVIALGAGLAIWGVINLLEGYGQDNPASNGQYS